jgi:hypothetical protein
MLPSSGMQRRVVLMRTDVSEEYIASIFRVENQSSTDTNIRTIRRYIPADDSIREQKEISCVRRRRRRKGVCKERSSFRLPRRIPGRSADWSRSASPCRSGTFLASSPASGEDVAEALVANPVQERDSP